jgi:hypothetical protein
MHSAQSQVSIPVMLGDTGRTLRINLSDGSNPYVIADGCLAKITIKRPKETRLEEFCTIEANSTIVYPFSQNTCAEEGIHSCDVTLYGLDGSVITSPRFTMVVSERVVRSDEVVISVEDQTAIDAVLTREASRVIAETQRAEAETARAEAESARATAEEQRKTAETQRAEAEEARAESIRTIEELVGDIETTLDNIITIQENYIGGEVV